MVRIPAWAAASAWKDEAVEYIDESSRSRDVSARLGSSVDRSRSIVSSLPSLESVAVPTSPLFQLALDLCRQRVLRDTSLSQCGHHL